MKENPDKKLRSLVLKKQIEEILRKLNISHKWKEIASFLFDDFVKKGYKYDENKADDLKKLSDLIKTNLSYDDRNNIKFLSDLYDILRRKEEVIDLEIPNYDPASDDPISILCNKYLARFSERKFSAKKEDFENLVKYADAGHLLARRTLGDYFLYGGNLGIPNFIESHRYYTLAAEDGCYISAYQLGELYLNKNGFFYHEALAYKYYDLALANYFKKIAEIIKDNKEINSGIYFPNVFHKVAYYNGYLRSPVDDGCFFAISYLGYIYKDAISSLYFAYALCIGKGCNEDLDTAISLYQELSNRDEKSYFSMIALARLALIYRDIKKEEDKYLGLMREFSKRYFPNYKDESKVVFEIEWHGGYEATPRAISLYISKNKKELWNCNTQFQNSLFDKRGIGDSDMLLQAREERHKNWKTERTVRLG